MRKLLKPQFLQGSNTFRLCKLLKYPGVLIPRLQILLVGKEASEGRNQGYRLCRLQAAVIDAILKLTPQSLLRKKSALQAWATVSFICAFSEVLELLYMLHVIPSMKARPVTLLVARNWQDLVHEYLTPPSGFGGRRYFHPTMERGAKIQPAKRVAGKRQDVWYVTDLLLLYFGVLCSNHFPKYLTAITTRCLLKWVKSNDHKNGISLPATKTIVPNLY
jgi:hypothetical protein